MPLWQNFYLQQLPDTAPTLNFLYSEAENSMSSYQSSHVFIFNLYVIKHCKSFFQSRCSGFCCFENQNAAADLTKIQDCFIGNYLRCRMYKALLIFIPIQGHGWPSAPPYLLMWARDITLSPLFMVPKGDQIAMSGLSFSIPRSKKRYISLL